MRGTHELCRKVLDSFGLIPTYAGNTSRMKSSTVTGGAHPHVCGEHSQTFSTKYTIAGSSPRMRGTPRWCSKALGIFGLIPTYAGNTRSIDTSTSPRRAHPHVCGEHVLISTYPFCVTGSSPRMRGTQEPLKRRIIGAGLIPTYAGNTHPARCSRWRVWAHPHVCGEHE